MKTDCTRRPIKKRDATASLFLIGLRVQKPVFDRRDWKPAYKCFYSTGCAGCTAWL